MNSPDQALAAGLLSEQGEASDPVLGQTVPHDLMPPFNRFELVARVIKGIV